LEIVGIVSDAKLYGLDAPVEPAIYVPHMQRPAGSRTLEFADAAPRLHAFATVFATLALTLATVGIYGLTAYSVSRRTHEIGLRVALGANQPQILRLVVGSGLVTALIGAGIGVAAVFEVTRGLSGMLYGLPRPTRWCSPAVPLTRIAVSVLASYVPARKATRIDPLVASEI
jgi:ABC-type antimicrobial peptide transport system permease subunit